MPLLNGFSLAAMLQRAALRCAECKWSTPWNYCRQCDEFFTDLHVPGCRRAEHVGHRRYELHNSFGPECQTCHSRAIEEGEAAGYRIMRCTGCRFVYVTPQPELVRSDVWPEDDGSYSWDLRWPFDGRRAHGRSSTLEAVYADMNALSRQWGGQEQLRVYRVV